MTKRQFVEKLAAALPDGNDAKESLLDAARKLIPSKAHQRQITALVSSRHVQRAVEAYHALNPETAGEGQPNISDLIEWLLDMGAVAYSAELEGQLNKINEILMSFGTISSKETFTLTGTDIIVMRAYSSRPLYLRVNKT